MNVIHCDICGKPIDAWVEPTKIWDSVSVDFGPLQNENFAICGKCRKVIVEYSGTDKTSQLDLSAIPDEIDRAHWK